LAGALRVRLTGGRSHHRPRTGPRPRSSAPDGRLPRRTLPAGAWLPGHTGGKRAPRLGRRQWSRTPTSRGAARRVLAAVPFDLIIAGLFGAKAVGVSECPAG